MSLPRFDLDDEAVPSDAAITARLSAAELDALDDATQPAQFLLKLPDSFVRRLTAGPARPFERPAPPARLALPAPPLQRVSMATPSAAWTMEAPRSSLPSMPSQAAHAAKNTNLLAVAASVIVGCVLVIAGVAGTGSSAEPDPGPVGIAVHAPKTLEKTVRTRDRETGYAPKLAALTVSIESLHHARRRRF